MLIYQIMTAPILARVAMLLYNRMTYSFRKTQSCHHHKPEL
jgi:hypothetical protein